MIRKRMRLMLRPLKLNTVSVVITMKPEAIMLTLSTDTPSRTVLAVKAKLITELARAALKKLPPEMMLDTIREPASRLEKMTVSKHLSGVEVS